jgi:flavin-dependent dehydrogenase
MALKTIAIIGGGPAGATVAERLAEAGAGLRVLVFEEKLGWEKPCGGGVPHQVLRRYPFLLQAAEPHTLIQDFELAADDGQSVRFPLRRPLAIYSRAVLNNLLLDRARRAGAEVIEERILAFAPRERGPASNGGGGGWQLNTRRNHYFADYLVLAAGARTQLRRRLTSPFPARDFMLTFGYYLPGTGTCLRIQFFKEFEGYAWSFPRPDHSSVGICGKVGEATIVELKDRLDACLRKGFGGQASLRQGFGRQACLREWQGDPATSDLGGRERDPGASKQATVFSHLLPALSIASWDNLRLAGPLWALAGDAAGLVDPVTGEGIYFAMRSGELLAAALLEGAPETYPQRVWQDFGHRLALGARLAKLFYHDTFLGEPSTTRLVQLARKSSSFQALLQDLIDGSQSYPGLGARLYRVLGRSIVEVALGLRQSKVESRKLKTENGSAFELSTFDF